MNLFILIAIIFAINVAGIYDLCCVYDKITRRIKGYSLKEYMRRRNAGLCGKVDFSIKDMYVSEVIRQVIDTIACLPLMIIMLFLGKVLKRFGTLG